jgi:hypothetical protein
MGELQLYGMKAAFDEVMTTAVKRQHEPQRIIGDLLTPRRSWSGLRRRGERGLERDRRRGS